MRRGLFFAAIVGVALALPASAQAPTNCEGDDAGLSIAGCVVPSR